MHAYKCDYLLLFSVQERPFGVTKIQENFQTLSKYPTLPDSALFFCSPCLPVHKILDLPLILPVRLCPFRPSHSCTVHAEHVEMVNLSLPSKVKVVNTD